MTDRDKARLFDAMMQTILEELKLITDTYKDLETEGGLWSDYGRVGLIKNLLASHGNPETETLCIELLSMLEKRIFEETWPRPTLSA
jgi:hypothetical protein